MFDTWTGTRLFHKISIKKEYYLFSNNMRNEDLRETQISENIKVGCEFHVHRWKNAGGIFFAFDLNT